jgi:undecaprenyl-phosphate galactose phosphotransferase
MKPTESVFLSKTRWYCSRRFEKWLLVSTDVMAAVLALAIAAVCATAFHDNDWYTTHSSLFGPARLQGYAFLCGVMVIAFWSKGHYTKRKPFANEVKDVLAVTFTLAMVDATLMFLTKWQFSRAVTLINWALAPVAITLLRWAVKLTLVKLGGWVRPMVIIGYGENAIETALAFKDESMMGLRLAAFLIPAGKPKLDHDIRDRNGNLVPSITLSRDPNLVLSQLGRPHVVLALEQGDIEVHQEMILQLTRHNQEIQIVPALRGLPLYGMEANHFFAHEVLLLTMRNNLARRLPQLVKRCFDLAVSATVLLVGAPVFLFIATRVASTGKPIFFGHTRVGQHNKPFKCYKFRTMAPNADKLLADLLATDPEARAEWERDFKLKNDPRITPIGRFLRKTSLDEIPQLWNVLKGDMSLVGPRPVVTAELERYGSQVDFYLEAKPGITGLWQISGRNDVTYETRVYLDAWYVKNWSLFNDIVILFRTVKVIFRTDGAY